MTKVVFFGSGPVAAESLRLLSKDFEVEAVVTKPKPAHHKGVFPVIEAAEELKLNTLTVSNQGELDELLTGAEFESQVGVLIDFGIIVSKTAIEYFSLGIVNSHFSLLPQWRGADPISFSVISGQEKTGVSLMLIDEGMDTGMLLAQKSMKIEPYDTTPSLTAKLIQLSNDMLLNILPQYVAGTVKPRRQPHPDRATYSRKLTKNDGVIDWNKPAEQIEREIRAYIDWPKSRTSIGGLDIIITSAHAVPSNDPDKIPGDVEVASGLLMVECGAGYLCIDKLKPAGKNEMNAAAFIAGYGKLLKTND